LGVELVSPVPGPTPTTTTEATDADGEVVAKLTIDDFAVDERTGKVEACPAGRIPLQVVYDEETSTTTIHMSPEECGACSFRSQCPIELGKSTCKVSYTVLSAHRFPNSANYCQQRSENGPKTRVGPGQCASGGRRDSAHLVK
jgi:hypothetical protein